MEALIESMGLSGDYFKLIINKYPHATLLNAERIMIWCIYLMEARDIAY